MLTPAETAAGRDADPERAEQPVRGELAVGRGVAIPARDLRWTAVRSSGAGGQHVNKVATKVALRFDLPGSEALSDPVKARLRGLARGQLDGAGFLVVVSQRTRSQARNLRDARTKLAALIRRALLPPKPRVPTQPSRGARRRRLDNKRRMADKKRLRRRVRHEDG